MEEIGMLELGLKAAFRLLCQRVLAIHRQTDMSLALPGVGDLRTRFWAAVKF